MSGEPTLRQRVSTALGALAAVALLEVVLVVVLQLQSAFGPGVGLALVVMPLALVGLALAVLIAADRHILRPLEAMAKGAYRMAGGDPARLPARHHELGVLIGAVAELRTRVGEESRETAEATGRLRAAHAELLAIVNTVPAALVILHNDGRVRLQNRAADHLIGAPPDGAVPTGELWGHLIIRDKAGKPLKPSELAPIRALEGIETVGEEVELQRPEGRRAAILIGAATLRDYSGNITGAVAAFQDITRLRELDRMKDDFVAIVSHELRTPLTAIRGALQLLLAENDSVPDPDNRNLVSIALTSCERLVRIINDILDISKIEAGQLQLRIGSIKVVPFVARAVDDVRSVADEAGVRIAIAVADGLSPIRGDDDRMTQALVNLLSNAIKFAPRDSTITVSGKAKGDQIAISVADEGRGIAPEDLNRLFAKFQQLDDPETRRSGGTGLGLTITKAIVEEHGGTISVESTVGRGTTFTMVLPRAIAAPGGLVVMPGPDAAAGTTAGRPVVLVADEDEWGRASVARAMQAAGFRTVEAATADDTLRRAAIELPDAITIPFSMRTADGHSVAELLGQHTATRPIPLVISMQPSANETRAEKPLDVSDIVTRVERTLEGRSHATVLVADDDAEVRMVLRKTLERHGFQVVEAMDGKEALALTIQHPIDLLLLDLNMPEVHGYDVIRALRRRETTAQLPIIVLSGSVGERHSLESLVLGANVFVTKPADADALVREVDRLVRREPAEAKLAGVAN
jgi:PAS domain S-box-containing protein